MKLNDKMDSMEDKMNGIQDIMDDFSKRHSNLQHNYNSNDEKIKKQFKEINTKITQLILSHIVTAAAGEAFNAHKISFLLFFFYYYFLFFFFSGNVLQLSSNWNQKI